MSSAFYARLAATAERLLSKYGRPAMLERQGEAVTGSGEPWRPDRAVPSNLPVRLVEADGVFSKDSGTVIPAGAIEGYMSARVEPLKTDRLIDGGRVWIIDRVKPIRPGPVPVLYKFIAHQ